MVFLGRVTLKISYVLVNIAYMEHTGMVFANQLKTGTIR
jgi:hypothetical protein